jgi:menaquinone-dependent protoporphyrinogen IX oxidase
MKKLLIVGIIVLVVIVALLVSVFAVLTFDLMSYGATGSDILNPTGASIGHALIVYNPGLSGSAKQAATIIAGELQAKGYIVDLAGVRSKTAANASSYDIIVVGGPMYFGQATSSIEGYLKTLTLQQQAKLGVFVTTGSSKYAESDFLSLQQQVTSATNHPATIKMILNGNETQNCADLTSALLQ